MNDGEVAKLKSLLQGYSKGAFLRVAALGAVVNRPSEINLSTYSELASTAANLNQIARHLNSGGAADAEVIAAELAAFRLALLGLKS